MQTVCPRRRLAALLLILCCAPAGAAINEDQVLVVYNSALQVDTAEDSSPIYGNAIYDYYKTIRPNVIGFDLNDASLSGGNISYADYETKVATPIRNFLNAETGRASNTAVITLTKGIPHRILDADLANQNAGDDPIGQATTKTLNNTATFASVDSELTLLMQDLRSGNPSTSMGTKSNNLVLNPYYGQTTSFTSYNRSVVTTPATFTNVDAGDFNYWQMTSNPGYLYLTTRLDGYSVASVKAMLDRSKTPIQYEKINHAIVLDSNGSNFDNGTYAATAAYLAANNRYVNVITDNSGQTFLIGSNTNFSVSETEAQRIPAGLVALLASYGGNHDFDSQAGYLNTFSGTLARGAIMNTLESYNGKDFSGVGGYDDQGQLAQWIELGGTFGVGNVWEPFAFTLADTSMIVPNFMFNGLTWAEAAWSSLEWLSWQQMVIGDPLATAFVVVPEPSAGAILMLGASFLLKRRRR